MRRAVDPCEGLQAEVAKVGDASGRWAEVALLEQGTSCNCGSQRYIIPVVNNLSHE